MNETQRILTLVATALILFVSVYGCVQDSRPEPQATHRVVVTTATTAPATVEQVVEGTIARDAYGQEWIWHGGQWRRLYR